VTLRLRPFLTYVSHVSFSLAVFSLSFLFASAVAAAMVPGSMSELEAMIVKRRFGWVNYFLWMVSLDNTPR